jgi:hypothetical protein
VWERDDLREKWNQHEQFQDKAAVADDHGHPHIK